MKGALSRRSRSSFTLIELLVVVAIIALLISILLPSLSKARAQARTTLCNSRLKQIADAMNLYGGDFEEAFPFIAMIVGGEISESGVLPLPTAEAGETDTWLGSTEDMILLAEASQYQAGPYPEDADVPRSGDLFEYTRFESLYKCPEFERIGSGEKQQNVFNYTRAAWGRRYRIPGVDPGATTRYTLSSWKLGDQGGPIMKPSMVYAPSALMLMIDEQWNRHIAGSWPNGSTNAWICCDPVFDMVDEVGQYHGPRVNPKHSDPNVNAPIQSGSIAYYDGHVALRRDPFPSAPGQVNERPTNPIHYLQEYIQMFEELAFAQLGRNFSQCLGK